MSQTAAWQSNRDETDDKPSPHRRAVDDIRDVGAFQPAMAASPRRRGSLGPFHVKPLHARYAEMVRGGPSGLFSRNDVARLDDHIADGCTGAPILMQRGVETIVDVGSGGGVPGLQLAIELPDSTVHLVESQQWKADFLRVCARALDLESRVRVHACRAEQAEREVGGREQADAGTARALAAPIVVAEYLAPLVRVGGILLLWTTRAYASADEVRAHPDLGLGDPIIHPAPSPLRAEGVLLEWPKVAPCADRFPRRVGVAAKRPLA